MEKNAPILFENKAQCCACGACLNICPQKAIRMEKDAYGFLYPVIDKDRCVGCGLCKKVCSFTGGAEAAHEREATVYAAASSNDAILRKSSSGGIFAALAAEVIKKGGIVYGAAWEPDWNLCHMAVQSMDALEKLQGSKYVQSDTRRTFSEVKTQLEQGRHVLYCGTPCQISGLRGYLGREYDHLITIDIVCHGVPNSEWLKADLCRMSQASNPVTDMKFRDKSYGWGTCGSYICADGKIRRYSAVESAYYYYFLRGAIYRESCYNCRFPSQNRVGDITLGDYWGIESAHRDAGNCIDVTKGVSCVLVNTEKGEKLLSQIKEQLSLIPSQLDYVKRRNGQLSHCCQMPPERERILNTFAASGYSAVVRDWRNREGKKILLLRLKRMIPDGIKRRIKSM